MTRLCLQVGSSYAKKTEDFKKKWKEIGKEISLSSWFSATNWPKAVTFAVALCGYLASAFAIFLYCRGRFQQGMFQSLMIASLPKEQTLTLLRK